MKTHTMALLAGIAIGATAVQGLSAQTAKPKAYSVAELEILEKEKTDKAEVDKPGILKKEKR